MTESANFSIHPSKYFIERPIATSLLMVALFLTGILAYRLLAVSALPQVDYPTIQVTTLYPGASPDVITSTITAPLERQFGQMPGLKQMSSTSAVGASVITLQFQLKLDIDNAEQSVQAAINAADNFLPKDLPMPPLYNKVNPADAPIMTLGITSPSLPLTQVEDMIETRLAHKLSQLPGIGLVRISGGQKPAVRIQVNNNALAAYNLSLEDLRLAIAAANVNLPKGMFDGPFKSAIIDNNDQLKSAAEYGNLVIAYRNSAPVLLRNVAEAVDASENVKLAAWANDKPAVLLNIYRQPGANVIEVADKIQQILPVLKDGLPGTIDIEIISDRTVTIRESVHDVLIELIIAVILVISVIYLFLRNVPATIIPGIAVPLSLIGTFSFMYLADFSINNLTLMALTIASGFVVDDAIVVIENIARFIEKGDTPKIAAHKGSQQIGFTIISLTLSLVAVLIPLLFMGDVVGRLFREFAITLAVSIILSGFISLTLTPMMCAKILSSHQAADIHTPFFNRIQLLYAQSLSWVMGRRSLTLWIAMGTLLLTALLFFWIPKGFFPVQDTGLIQGISEGPASLSYRAMREQQSLLSQKLTKDPAIDHVSAYVGVDGDNLTPNTGRLLLQLKPLTERNESASEVIERLNQSLSGIDGIQTFFQPVQDLTLENQISKTQFQFTLQGIDHAELVKWSQQLLQVLGQFDSMRDIASNLDDKGLQAYIDIDRATASRLNVSTAAIDNALYNAFGQRQVSTIFTQANQYRVILEVDPEKQLSPRDLDLIRIPSVNGNQVPLSALATITERNTPLSLDHLDQFPSVTISFNLSNEASLGDAITAIQTSAEKMNMPKHIQIGFQGATQAFTSSRSDTLWLILAAIVTVYIVLGILYESYIHPITILSTLPSAGIGALLALLLTGKDLGIIGIIGIILLIGIVKKNAIMMIDFALEAERQQGLSAEEAIYQACLLRLRPILMTTLCALLGALPLILGTGMGAELRSPLGITMIGGLIFSQLLTLFTTPVIYLALDSLARYRLGSDKP